MCPECDSGPTRSPLVAAIAPLVGVWRHALVVTFHLLKAGSGSAGVGTGPGVESRDSRP